MLYALDTETDGDTKRDTADPRRATFVMAAVAPLGVVTYMPPRVAPSACVVVHNSPYDQVVIGQWDAQWHDTKMLAHLAGEPDTSLKGLVRRFLHRPAMGYEEAMGSGQMEAYCLADAANTLELYPLLRDNLPPETLALYDELEAPMLALWAKMTIEGEGYIDHEALRPHAEALRGEVAELEEQLGAALPSRWVEDVRCGRCGKWKKQLREGERCDEQRTHDWKGGVVGGYDAVPNVNAPEQVLAALHSLGIDVPSTGADVLGDLEHPVVQLLLRYRGASKELGTYVEPWLAVPPGQRFGCVWRPMGVRNGGRVSSAYPNRQNVPHRLEKYVTAGEGHRFIEWDNSQLEVRIAAALSQDPVLLSACHNDFHSHMMGVYGLSDRRRAKTRTFGNLYLGGPGFVTREAKKNGETLAWKEAEQEQAEFRRTLPTYYRWAIRRTQERVVKGMFGAWHHIPDERDEAGQGRQAVNDPIQGGAGRVTKYQMLALHRAGFEVVRQVHDSVRVRVREEDYEDARVEGKRVMESAAPDIGVPIVVEEKGEE